MISILSGYLSYCLVIVWLLGILLCFSALSVLVVMRSVKLVQVSYVSGLRLVSYGLDYISLLIYIWLICFCFNMRSMRGIYCVNNNNNWWSLGLITSESGWTQENSTDPQSMKPSNILSLGPNAWGRSGCLKAQAWWEEIQPGDVTWKMIADSVTSQLCLHLRREGIKWPSDEHFRTYRPMWQGQMVL